MNVIYFILFLIASVFAGYLIAWLSRDELIIGRKWFQILVIGSFVAGLGFFIFGYPIEMFICAFILIISWISYMKSRDKKWIKKN